MRKIFSKICSVALIGGALAGLAVAGNSVVQKKANAPEPEKKVEAPARAAGSVVLCDYDFANNKGSWAQNWTYYVGGSSDYYDYQGFEVDFSGASTSNAGLESKSTFHFTGGQEYIFRYKASSNGKKYNFQVRAGINSVALNMASSIIYNEEQDKRFSRDADYEEFTWTPAADCDMYLRVLISNPGGYGEYYISAFQISYNPAGSGGDDPIEEPEGKEIPYSSNFYDEGLNGFTVIDVNNDGRTWTNEYGYAKYTYHGTNQGNDWLITPALKVEGGKKYTLSVPAYNNGMKEDIEIYGGKEPTVEGMTDLYLDTHRVAGNVDSPEVLEFDFTPAEDGLYYFGFHAVSEADQYYLYLKDIKVEDWRPKAWPAPAENVVATPDENGELKATVTFDLPTLNAGGEALSDITSVVVKRCHASYGPVEIFNSEETQTVGGTLTITDEEIPMKGKVYYSVEVGNSAGTSVVAKSETILVGPIVPSYINGIIVARTENYGELVAEWGRVTTDNAWNALPDPSLVTYKVQVKHADGTLTLVGENIADTEYTFQAVTEGQENLKVVVTAYYKSWAGNDNESMNILCGFPYDGLNEDFKTEGKYAWNYDLGYDCIIDTDYDAGYMSHFAKWDNQSSYILSGLIDLKDYQCPVLKFTFAGPEDATISAMAQGPNDEYGFAYLNNGQYFTVKELGGDQNTPVVCEFDLSRYAGQVVQFRYSVYNHVSNSTVYISDIHVEEGTAYDLRAGSLIADPAVPGEEFNLNFTIFNDGKLKAENFFVALYDTENIETAEPINLVPVDGILAGYDDVVEITAEMPKLQLEPKTYVAKIIFEDDQDQTNNVSAPVVVNPAHNTFAAASELNVEEMSGAARVTWTEAETVAKPIEPITCSFEDGETWSKSYKDWTFYDLDGIGCYQSWGPSHNNYIYPAGSPSEVFVYDGTTSNNSLRARTGNKCLIVDALNSGDCNDWIISPELYGGAQTIEFWVCDGSTFSNAYHDDITILYSTTGKEVEDFVVLKEAYSLKQNTTYEKFTADLPEGAKYFAIQRTVNGGGVCIDDVTFIPADDSLYRKVAREATYGGDLLGYNVYRDGELIAENVQGGEYIDYDIAPSVSYTYHVTANYTRGESAPTQPFLFIPTGITSVDLDAAGVDAIYTLTGVRVNPANIVPGVYVVVKNGKSVKAFVK